MAKKHRANLITASFHYLVKTAPNDVDPTNPIESPFTHVEFSRVLDRISNITPLDERDPVIISRIKSGQDLPFLDYEEVEDGLHFGAFDGAYYGQQYRNNVHGVISADSLNLRPFNYLITRLRDGRILIGVTYNGHFGDYDGLRNCLIHLMRGGNYQVRSRTITSVSDEIGNGTPIELRLTYRKESGRLERRGLFGKTGVLAIKSTEFGDGFGEEISNISQNVRGNVEAKKRALAQLVRQGNLLELDDDDIIGCSAIVRENGRTSTIYFLGGHNMATKFLLDVQPNPIGIPNRNEVRDEIIRVMRQRVMPLLG